MLTKKKKLSKKEIKQDKLVEAYYKAYGFVEENRQRLMLYGGIFVVVILAVIFYINNRKQKNEAAGVELARVMDLYDSGNYLEAIQGQPGTPIIGLKKIVEEYGNTPNGETSKIYLADAYNLLGKADDAYKYYKDYDGSISLYKASALAGQAAYFEAKKEYLQAADLYKQASHVSALDVSNPYYLVNAGINYMKAGKSKEAKETFENVQKNYKTTSSAREVEKYLVQLD